MKDKTYIVFEYIFPAEGIEDEIKVHVCNLEEVWSWINSAHIWGKAIAVHELGKCVVDFLPPAT